MGLVSFLAERGRSRVYQAQEWGPLDRVPAWLVGMAAGITAPKLWCFVSVSRVLPSISCNSLWQERGLKTTVWLLFQICFGLCRVPEGRGVAKLAQETAAPLILAGTPSPPWHSSCSWGRWALPPGSIYMGISLSVPALGAVVAVCSVWEVLLSQKMPPGCWAQEAGAAGTKPTSHDTPA